jgi:hypothetical protein
LLEEEKETEKKEERKIKAMVVIRNIEDLEVGVE